MATLLSGCTAVKTMVGVNEPDLEKIGIGVPRAAVEKTLGKCLWYVGEADGLSYNIYQFENEKPAKPVSGVLIMGLDYITLGTMELGLRHSRDFGQAKQVAVAYDHKNQVAFVSKPWPAQDIGPCRRQRFLIPKDSGIPTTAHPAPLIGLNDSVLNTAILDDADLEVKTIDGHVPEEAIIELQPGHHKVKHHGYVATVEFFPGRHYRMDHESFYGVARSRPFYFIEDVDSRETLMCLNPGQIQE